MKLLNPKDFGLHFKTVIEEVDDHTVAIVMNRKSRIIMADGKKIVERFEVLQKFYPNHNFTLKTSAPVCNKTKLFLKKQKISIFEL